MTWDELSAQTRKASETAAEKLGAITDLAVLKLQLRTEKARLRTAYEEFGEIAYLSFTSEDNDAAEVLAEYIKAISLSRSAIASLEQQIQKKSPPYLR